MSLRFTGNDDQGLSRPISLPDRVFTVVAWLWLSVDRNAFSTPIDLSVDTGNYGQFSTDGTGTLFGIHVSGADSSPNVLDMPLNGWHRCATYCDGTTLGLSMATETGPFTTVTTGIGTQFAPTTLRLGWSVWPGEGWDGRIGGPKMWTTRLTDAQWEEEFTRPEPLVTAGIFGAWDFSSLPGTNDLSSAGNDLSAGVAAPTVEDDPPFAPAAVGGVTPGAFFSFFPDRVRT